MPAAFFYIFRNLPANCTLAVRRSIGRSERSSNLCLSESQTQAFHLEGTGETTNVLNVFIGVLLSCGADLLALLAPTAGAAVTAASFSGIAANCFLYASDLPRTRSISVKVKGT